jgi:DNA-binding transcriptional MerR regulator
VAWYDDGHLERLARIRSLQQRGYTLATIVRLVNGELDAADEALLGELTGGRPDGRDRDGSVPPTTGGPPAAVGTPEGTPAATGSSRAGGSDPGAAVSEDEPTFTLEGLAGATGIPLALLKAVEAEGLLIPRRLGTEDRYTAEDVDASRAALLLLEWGIPLSDLLALARRHHEATETVARQAVAMFSEHVRGPLRQGRHPKGTDPATGCPDPDEQIAALLQAYADLLPAVTTLVGHHFTRSLVKAALDHVEQVGSIEEREAIWEQVEATGGPGPRPSPGLRPRPSPGSSPGQGQGARAVTATTPAAP